MIDEAEWTYRIGKLAPKPGEIIVVKMDFEPTNEAVDMVLEQFRQLFKMAGLPPQPVLILPKGMNLMVVDPADFGPKE